MFTETAAEFVKIMRRLEILSSTMEQTKTPKSVCYIERRTVAIVQALEVLPFLRWNKPSREAVCYIERKTIYGNRSRIC
jgi:hypothetical protein